MYLINYLGFVGKKTNTKTLRENIFPSPFPRLLPSCHAPPLWCGSNPAAGNITFPNHQLTQDSVFQTPRAGHSACCWLRCPRSGGTGPCAECHMEQQPQEETGCSAPAEPNAPALVSASRGECEGAQHIAA